MGSVTVKRIGKYEVLDVLGKGGMGVVYKATDPAIGRLVAIKMITAGYAEDPDFLRRFYREAQSTGKLQHQNIVIVHDLGDQDGTPFLVMEFLEGESLQSVINSHKAMPLLEKLGIIIQACNGLHYAHQRNVVHRDIKPANLMILRDGLVKIVDFGIARIENESVTLPGQVVGTIHYMSPEQINGVAVDCRTDIFATGVVLYQLLTYSLPFQGKDTGSTLLKIINEPPPPLQRFLDVYPPELDHIVQRALAKSREDRYATAEDFAFDLSQVQDQLKRELVSEYLKVAEDLLARSELTKAKEQVFQILKVDRQNRHASQLLREVQRLIQNQQRSEQISQLRAQADDAIAAQQLERALKYLDQALSIDPENRDVRESRDRVSEQKLRLEKIQDSIRRAESAQVAGELDEALAAVEEALKLGPDDLEAKALHSSINRDIQERNRQLQLQELVGEAQRQISSRRFTEAIAALQKAEELDPSAPGVKDLMTLAANGREQERRRKEIEQVTSEIQDALNRDDYLVACAKAEEALQRFPNERSLLKLQSLSERQRQAGEKRHFIDEHIAEARRLLQSRQTDKALEVLDAACQRFPTEASLLSLHSVVRQTLDQERTEARKNDYIQRAKEALRRKDYDEATNILEAGRAEINVPEIEDLLQFVKEEAAADARRQVVDAAAHEAHRLISAEEYEDAIKFLEAVLQEVSDGELEIFLADARRQREDFNRRVSEAVETGNRLLRAGRFAEAVRYLESQTQPCGRAAEFREVLEHARREQEHMRVIASAVQSARTALLAQDFDSALQILAHCRQSQGDHPALSQLETEVEAERREAASKPVSKAIADARMLLLGRSYQSALELLDGVAALVEFDPNEIRDRHLMLRQEAVRGLDRARKEYESRITAPPPPPGDDEGTEQQLEWNAPMSSTAVALKKNRARDLEELTQLRQEADIATTWAALDALSKRARSIADRHRGDEELEGVANTIALRAETRARELQTSANAAPHSDIATLPPAPAPPEKSQPAVSTGTFISTPQSVPPISAPQMPMRVAAEESQPAATNFDAAPELDIPGPAADVVSMPQPATSVTTPEVHGTSALRAPAPSEENQPPARTPVLVPPVLKKPAPPRFVVLVVGLVLVGAVIGLIVWRGTRKVSPPPPGSLPVVVRTAPNGAVVRVKNGPVCTTPNCTLNLTPGTYNVTASLAGYAPQSSELVVGPGGPPAPLSIALKPLDPALNVNGNFSRAKVQLDGKDVGALVDGQFSLAALQPGEHSIDIAGSDGQAGFQFRADPAQAPVVSSPVSARNISVLVVNTLGGKTHVDCNCSGALKLAVDGREVGELNDQGRNLGDLGEGVHQLQVGTGDDARTVSVKLGSAPAMQVFLNAERDAGTLIVESEVDNADVFINDKKYRRLTEGTLRIPLDARKYQIHLEKKGYQSSEPQEVEIKKNQETRLSIDLQPSEEKAFLSVRGGVPGTKISVDGKSVGTVDDNGKFYSTGVAPGPHTVMLEKDGYEPRKLETTVRSGEIKNLAASDVQLAKAATPPPTPQPGAPVATVDAAQRDWEQVRNSSDAKALQGYVDRYPNSQFSAQARNRIEQIDWDHVKDATDPSQLQAFVNKHPSSQFVATAKANIEKLNSARADAERARAEAEHLGSERRAVVNVIKQYSAAFHDKNVDKVTQLYPDLDKQQVKKLRDVFRSAQSVQMDLRPTGDPQINGNSATVVCQRSTQYTFPEGPQNPPDDVVTIQLKKNGSSWVLQGIQ